MLKKEFLIVYKEIKVLDIPVSIIKDKKIKISNIPHLFGIASYEIIDNIALLSAFVTDSEAARYVLGLYSFRDEMWLDSRKSIKAFGFVSSIYGNDISKAFLFFFTNLHSRQLVILYFKQLRFV
jgi:hypothetical protein